jgi:hypothetical protein
MVPSLLYTFVGNPLAASALSANKEEKTMKHLLVAAAAAAALTMAVPASAQVTLDAGPRGAEVHVGPRHDMGRHEGWRRHHENYRAYNACKTTRERIVLPNGRVIVKSRSTC